MAANVDIIALNEIPKCDEELNQYGNVKYDAEIIVREILLEIFNTAVNKSDESQKEKVFSENPFSETGDLIDLTRNYKQEFRTILQNLKCNKNKTQQTNNASLEDQIKKVIDEIKSLETTVRLNIHQEGRGDTDLKGTQSYTTNLVDYKSEISDFFNDNSEDEKQQLFIAEDINDEVVLQVIDLQQEDSDRSSLTNVFPSDEDLEEVTLTSRQSINEIILNQGDQGGISETLLPEELSSAGETAVINPVPNPEPNEILEHPEEGRKRKKKSLGKRIWNFIKKSGSCHSIARKKNENNK